MKKNPPQNVMSGLDEVVSAKHHALFQSQVNMTHHENFPKPSEGRWAPTSYQWAIEMYGNEHWLESFNNRFNSVDIIIIPDYEDDRPTFYDLTSPHLNGLTATEATMRAKELLILFNGVMRVREGYDFRDFTAGKIVEVATRRRHPVDSYRAVPQSLFPDDVENLRYLRTSTPLDRIGAQLFLSRSDPHLRYIYRTLGRDGVTFVSLFKVLDTIEADFKARDIRRPHREIASLGGKSEDDLGDFAYTANNFDIAGFDARHGMNAKFKLSGKRKALSLEQAANILLPIVRGYENWRLADSFKQKWDAVLINSRDELAQP